MSPVLLLLLFAHDLYLMPKNFRPAAGERVLIAFHNGDDFPESAAAPRLERLIAPGFEDLRVDGKVALGTIRAEKQSSLLLHASTKPNFIELSGPKFESYLRHEGLVHVLAEREKNAEQSRPGREIYSKYVKSLLKGGDAQKRVGYPIEILLEADPYTKKPGDTVILQVLVEGQAAADLQIEACHLTPEGKVVREIPGRTDKDGRLSIPLRAAGIWKLHTVTMRPHRDPAQADWESFWASLTFEIR